MGQTIDVTALIQEEIRKQREEERKAQKSASPDPDPESNTNDDADDTEEGNDSVSVPAATKSADTPAVIDPDQIAADVLASMKRQQQEEKEREDAVKEYNDRVRRDAIRDYQKEQRAKGVHLPFDHDVEDDDDDDSDGMKLPEHLSRIQVLSPYDRLGDLDLAIRYNIRSRAAKMGAASPPSERHYRALMVRANKVFNAEDEIPKLQEDGSFKMEKVPAFDLDALVPWSDRERDDTYFVKGVGNVPVNDNVSPQAVEQMMKIGVGKANELVYSTQSGFGDQWVPTFMAATLWRRIRIATRVLSTLDQFDMPTQPYQWPKEGADNTVYGVSETTAENQLVIGANMPVPDSKFGTGNVVFSAGKIGALTFWSEEMNEDSIINPSTQFRDQQGLTMAHGIDDLLLNGDETTGSANISFDGSAITSNNKYLKLDGIRHEAFATTTTDNRDAGTLDVDDVRATRALMGAAGVNGADPSQLVIFCDLLTARKFEMLSEVLTVDKYGSNATTVRGELGNIMRIPIIQSQDYSLTDTAGKISATGGSNVEGSFAVVNRMGVKVGWRRRPRIIIGQVPFSDGWYILALARLDIGFFDAGMVGVSWGITV